MHDVIKLKIITQISEGSNHFEENLHIETAAYITNNCHGGVILNKIKFQIL